MTTATTKTITYAVYGMTPKGGFSQKYEGASLSEAEAAYNKLAKGDKPRNITQREGHLSTTYKNGGGFPQ